MKIPDMPLRIWLASLFVIAPFLMYAQPATDAYEAPWKRVDSLIFKKGLMQDARQAVKKIYARARKEKNSAQQTKALLYQFYLADQTEEEATVGNIRQLEKEYATATPVLRALLKSYEASLYQKYVEEHRYQIYNRAETLPFKKPDLSTWSAGDFRKKITELYLASIHEEKLLQQTTLKSLDPIILKGNTRHLRPTLYDLLSYRALEYFESDEPGITEPEYVFELGQETAFASAPVFVKVRFDSPDTLSLKRIALSLHQKLLQFHGKDKDPRPLIEADLLRLQFCYNHSVHPLKDSLYRNALQALTLTHKGHPATDQARYLVAAWHKAQEDTGAEPMENHGIKAKEICESVIRRRDSTEGKINCLRLLSELESKGLSLQLEKVNLPQQPFRALVGYRNIPHIYIRIIPLGDSLYQALPQRFNYNNDLWEQLQQLPFRKAYRQELVPVTDLREHFTEIKLDALPYGAYGILASAQEDFGTTGNIMAFQVTHVSRISFINQENRYYFLDREHGQPLPGTTATVWYRNYDYQTRNVEVIRGDTHAANHEGILELSPMHHMNTRSFRLELHHGEDRLFLDDDFYVTYRDLAIENIPLSYQSFLFTDRSIYRPGQLLFFKGIVTRKSGPKVPELASGFSTTLYLHDANGQVIDSIKLRTSAYGSYSGRFKLPEGKLNGSYTLRDPKGNAWHTFSVEDYKRPKFQVAFEALTKTYQLHDTISVTGTAMAYSGNPLGGARVRYRVIRRTFYPFITSAYLRSPGWPLPQEAEREISHGFTTTGAEGAFHISFKALPDAHVKRQDQPVFYFEVQADVTDINGETRSGSLSVPVSYQSLFVDIQCGETLPAAAFNKVQVRTQNQYGVPVPARLTVTLTSLQQPNRIFRTRYWQAPDQFIYNEETYHRYFPLDLHGREDQPAYWAVKDTMVRLTDTTSPSGLLSWPHLQPSPGWYRIEAAAEDERGNPVRTSRIVQLTGSTRTATFFYGKLSGPDSLNSIDSILPHAFESNLDNLTLIYGTQRLSKGVSDSLLQIRNGNIAATMRVDSSDQGGVFLSMAFIKHNRYYFTDLQVPIRHPEKELTVRLSSYRDKTLPGSSEQWKITIHAIHPEAKAAEVLTSMYDASLNAVKAHQWPLPSWWNETPVPVIYRGDPGFSAGFSRTRAFYTTPSFYVNKLYDRLVDLSLSSLRPTDQQYRLTLMPGAMETTAMIPDQKSEAETSATAKSMAKVTVPRVVPAPKAPEPAVPVPLSPVRKDFRETAFFFPELETDSTGSVSFSFTMPEALTQWRWMTLSHTRGLAMGYTEKEIITQKELMVQPNNPRFLREGDRMDYAAKIVNLHNQELTGEVELQLLDPETLTPVDGWFRNFFPHQYFTVPAGGSTVSSFTIEIPYQYNKPVLARVVARSGTWSDGEETLLPVVSNRILVTETMPITVSGPGTKIFRLAKLDTIGSETLNHHALTVEYTRNPAWYALLALPYLTESTYECSEQIFNRLYAHSLGAWLLKSQPGLQAGLSRWKTKAPGEWVSPLSRNEDLKSVILEETPWVLDARHEDEALARVALLLDSTRILQEQERHLVWLQSLQTPNGGFSWFPGGPDDRYITQYILAGLGQLLRAGVLTEQDNRISLLIPRALAYLDKVLKEDYDKEMRVKKEDRPQNPLAIYYRYLRSLLPQYPVDASMQKIYRYYYDQLKVNWIRHNLYLQGIIALTLYRNGDMLLAKEILNSLRQQALTDSVTGMYWKAFRQNGYYWSEAGIEAHALLTEAFAEITQDKELIRSLKKWLLSEKQTHHWPSTKATAAACYVLLKDVPDFTPSAANAVKILLDGKELVPKHPELPGGYMKETIPGTQVKSSMAQVTVIADSATSTLPLLSWGAMYWQYFENLDQITPSGTSLVVKKKLFRERLTSLGPRLELLQENDRVHPGDRIIVRIELSNRRPMEYVHLKDMRASCLEPVQTLSSYKYQGGLGYYETTRDAATHYFMAYLPKGEFTLEYPLQVTQTGTFHNGLTTVECLYAPEFTAHTESIRIISE